MHRLKPTQTTDPTNSIVDSHGEAGDRRPERLDPVPGTLQPEDLQMAHELRTPLTALKSAIDILCQSGLPAESDHIARIAQRNVGRIAEIVEAMLARRSSSGEPPRS
jgi:hypothetical protein